MASTGNARKTKKAGMPTSLLYYPLDGNINNYKTGVAVADATIIGTGVTISTTVSATGMASLYNTTNTTSYLKLPTIPANTAGYSFSLWVNFAATTTGMVFTLVNTATGTSRIFLYWNSSALVFGTNGTAFSKSTYLNSIGGTSGFATNTWYHIVWTLSTSGTSNLYINNVAQTSFTTTPYISTIFQENRILGDVYNGTAGNGANAYVNDFRYYNAILTSTQASTLYNIRVAQLSAPLLYYPLDGNINNYQSGSAVADATIIGTGATISTTISATGSASLYNTTNTTSYLKLPTIPANTNGYSFSLWVNFASLTTGMLFTLVNSPTGGSRVFLYLTNGGLLFGTSANTSTTTYLNEASVATSLAVNTWYHIVWTLSTSGTSKWYVNNIAQPSFTSSPYMTTIFQEARILGDVYNGTAGNGANAFVNDFRYYNAILTSTQASTLYNVGVAQLSAPLLYYPLDGNINNYKTGVAVADATIIGTGAAISTITSSIGTASLYNTTNTTSYLKLPTIPANTNGYSFSFRVNFTSLTMGMLFVFIDSAAGSTRIFVYWSGTSLRFATMNNLTQFTTYLNSGGASVAFAANTWYHIVWTLATNNTSKWYVNNIEQASFTTAIYITSAFTENRILGDVYNGTAGNGANAYINDFRYYNAILTSTQVTALYNVGFSTGIRSIPGCILWFDAKDPNNNGVQPVNGTSITSWKDKSGIGNNATNVGTVIYNTTGLNGLPSMTMNTSCNFTGAVSNTNNTLTIFGVCNMDTAASQIAARLISLGKTGVVDSGVAGYMGFLRQSVSGIQGYRAGATTSNEVIVGSVPYLFETWFDGTNNYNTVHQGTATAITSTTSTGAFAIENFCIGMSTGTAANGRFSGFISEIVVYNTALTTTQRQYIEGYLSWKWNLQSKLSPFHPYNSTYDYKFKIKATDTTVPLNTIAGYNYSTTYTLTNTGGVVTAAAVGPRTNVISLSGTNILSLPYNLPINLTRTFWCSSLTSQSGYGNVFSSNKNPVWFFSSKIMRSTVNFNQSPTWPDCSSTTTQTDTWLFYAITQTATNVSLYVNGVLSQTITNTGWAGDTGNVWIGGYGGNGGNYTGYVDDMRIYERALSTTEIQILYHEYIPFDFVFRIKGTASVPTATTAGLGYSTTYAITNTGTVVTTATVGTRTNVFNFIGNNYLQITYNIPIVSTRTFWVSTSTPQSSSGNIFSGSGVLSWFNGGTMLNSRANSWTIINSTVVQSTTWIFYAIIQTATVNSIYVNGVWKASTTNTGWTGGTGNIQFGAYNGAFNYTGYIDDIRLYARELSAAEILTLYTAG